MNISVNTVLAKQYGLEAGLLLQNFVFWVSKNIENKKNFFEGKYWTYNSINDLNKKYDFLSPSKIRYAIKKLVAKKIIITGNFNKTRYDRTTWYAFQNDDQFKEICHLLNSQIHLSESANPCSEINEPIPDNKTNSKNIDDIAESSSTVEPIIKTLKENDIKLTETQLNKIQDILNQYNKVSAPKYNLKSFINAKMDQLNYMFGNNNKKILKYGNKTKYFYCTLKDPDWWEDEYLEYKERQKIDKIKQKNQIKQQSQEEIDQQYNEYVQTECFKEYESLTNDEKNEIDTEIKKGLNNNSFYIGNLFAFNTALESRRLLCVMDRVVQKGLLSKEDFIKKGIVNDQKSNN